MIIDDITIRIKAGNGGSGKVSFNHNQGALGPSGGNGGRGGSVYLEGVSDLNALDQFRYEKELLGENGGDGGHQFVDGRNGEDLILKVPVGTVAHNTTTGFDNEITKIGQQLLIAHGGRGGKGNFLYRSSRDTSPKKFQPGLPGENFAVRLELKMIADVGFVGLPNVGKSSLLNELTNAKSKVANYNFTTLEPHLGTYYELILADIPGLIEGASAGKGLGIKFLKHIERTKIIFHFISAESADPVSDYKTIRAELEKYNPELTQKTEYVFISKTDTADEKKVNKEMTALKKLNKRVLPISIYDDESLDTVKKILNEIIEEKKKLPTGA